MKKFHLKNANVTVDNIELLEGAVRTCCMCDNFENELILRKNGDLYCKSCHEKHCEHDKSETIPVANGLDTITVCHDCGCEM